MPKITFNTIIQKKPEEWSEIIWLERDEFGSINVQIGEVDNFGDDELPDLRVNGITLHENGFWIYTSEIDEAVESL